MLSDSPSPKLTLYAPRVVHTDADGSLTVEGSILLSISTPMSKNRSLHVRHKVKISTLSKPPGEHSTPSSFSSSASSSKISWSSSYLSTSPSNSLEPEGRDSFSSTSSKNSFTSVREKKRKSGKLRSTIHTSDKVYLPLPIVNNHVPAGEHLITFRIIVNGSVYPTTSLPGATIFHSIVAKLPPTLQNVGAMAERAITVFPPPLAADTPMRTVTRRLFDGAIQVSIQYQEWVDSETTAFITASRVNPSDRMLDLNTMARVTETVNYRTADISAKRSWLAGLSPYDPDVQEKKLSYIPSPITPDDRLTEQTIGQVVLTSTPLLLPTDCPTSFPVRLAGADTIVEPPLRVDVHYPRVVTCRHALDLTFTLQEKAFSNDGVDTGVIRERADNVQLPLVIFGSIKSFERDNKKQSNNHTSTESSHSL